MARQREARAANAGEDRKQLVWVQESGNDAKKGLKNLRTYQGQNLVYYLRKNVTRDKFRTVNTTLGQRSLFRN